MIFRNRAIGFLTAFDRMTGHASFTEEDERLLQAFAASAATAVATAQTATDEALRRSLQASEEERRRWARELHDETLQELAGLRMLLSGAHRSGDPAALSGAVERALDLLTDGIANLRALITELRPAALDELGAGPAVEALIERVKAQSGLDIELDLRLGFEDGRAAERLMPEIEAAVYRLIQEALSNVVKHAEATQVFVSLAESDGDGCVTVEIRDDGRGFDPGEIGSGFGLIGMRERMALIHGSLEVRSRRDEGTWIIARMPVKRREPLDRESMTVP